MTYTDTMKTFLLIFSLLLFPDGKNIWNLPAFEPESGKYNSDWVDLSRNYNVPQWWREAKFGAWSHWDPQSAAEYGDWYARGMYMEGSPQYLYHLENYGHPSEYGYKDLCNDWDISRWDPDDLMQLFVKMGARYFLAMGNHHDNFDCWDSEYQPWNSVNVGPKIDIVGIWKHTADKYGMPFGVGFHATPARTYGQFMTVRYRADRQGEYKDVPYDAMLTKEDGKGQWWEGLDPQDLYGPVHHDGRNSLETPFAEQFMWRVDDAIRKYQPDMIYFDDHAGDSQIDLGINMGLGRLTPDIITNFYNIASKRANGNREVVATFKGVGGRYDSFQNSPEILPLVDGSLVKSTEFFTEDDIMAYPFQTEVSLQEWHYRKGAPYRTAPDILLQLMQNVSRNGSLLLNVTQRGKGDIDPEAREICLQIGAWLETNGEAVYGARPFDVWGNDSFIFTRNNGKIYVTLVGSETGSIILPQLAEESPSVGRVKSVEIVGCEDSSVDFQQDDEGLKLMLTESVKTDGFKVLRITHDKSWFNDDDPGVRTLGWNRICNLNEGHFNNDLCYTEVPGDVWSAPFEGRFVEVIAPVGADGGQMRVMIDGNDYGVISLMSEKESVQQPVFSRRLKKGTHTIELICLSGRVSVDALIIK